MSSLRLHVVRTHAADGWMALSKLTRGITRTVLGVCSSLKARIQSAVPSRAYESDYEREHDDECEISQRIHQYRDEIVKNLNHIELMSHLCEKGLLNSQDKAYLLKDCFVNEEKGECILRSVAASLHNDAHSRFLHCLQKETYHLGHKYIVSLLEGRPFADESKIQSSFHIQQQILKNRVIFEDIDLSTLVPIMLSKQLLTQGESDMLLDSKRQEKERILLLYNILETKGPLAHGLFAQCLDEEKHHPTHAELFMKLSCDRGSGQSSKDKDDDGDDLEADSPITKQFSNPRPVKRKRNDDSQALVECRPGPAKRFPGKWQMDGALHGRKYDHMMMVFQTCHHNGEWKRLETEARRYMGSSSADVRAVAKLEIAVSYIFRGERMKVIKFVNESRQDIALLTAASNNAIVLEGRCEHVLSCLYRYSKEFKEALKHAELAKVKLFNVEPGEDTAWANYCEACIRVECLAENYSTMEETKVEAVFERAIDDARNHNTGIDVVEPHSLIRLAQLKLGSSQYTAGRTNNCERIKAAKNCLEAVRFDTLSSRSKSLFYVFDSDVHLNMGDKNHAICSALMARDLAMKDNYAVELRSAEERLQSLRMN